jgi:Tol biopolymer transport system component
VALTAGTRLGPYEIAAPIGAGGMGEVYKATDTRLHRTVAVKVLPDHVASNPDLKQRFEREAKALAALSHPHICPVFDVGSLNEIDFLVMEYLEGETLEQRLKKGALPLAQALQTGIQIADALAAAHRAGIVHRDLKPGNIMLAKSGAKLLDFGLAKTDPAAVAGSPSMLPTTPPGLTQQGSILGTVQYMAPEQLEGEAADPRTDIFAFGAVFHEMVTGRLAFEGKSQASLIGAILKDDPRPLSTLQPLAPPLLERIVAKSLAKNPDARWQSASDLRDEMQWAMRAPSLSMVPHVAGGRDRVAWTIACVALVAAAMAVATAWYIGARSSGTVAPEMRLEVSMPGRFEDWVAVSPDARSLVSGGLADGKWQLWLRRLDSTTARPLAGTEGAVYPFWSPDSRSIAFFAEGKLKRIDVAGGPPQTLANAREPRGGTWGPDGTIIFAPTLYGGLYRVSASGGEAKQLTRLESGQRSHRFPSFLPDGFHFLYFDTASGTYLGTLDEGAPKRITPTVDSAMLYTPPGMLLFVRERTLMAQPFSLETYETSGELVRIAELAALTGTVNTGSISVSASANGTIAFRGASEVPTGGMRLAWFDRSGQEIGGVAQVDPGFLVDMDLSPDATHIAATRSPNRALGGLDVWVTETERGVSTRLTSDPATDQLPVWSPDGKRIVFASNRKGTLDLFEAPFNSSGSEKPLLELPGTTYPTDWSSDGRFVLYGETSPASGYDLWALPMFGDRKPIPVANREFDEVSGRLSRDLRWVAYESNEAGRFEIVVQAFRDPTVKWQISSGGGMQPRWRDDGRELFYVAADGTLMAAPIIPLPDGGTLQPGRPAPLVRNRLVFDAYRGVRFNRYAVTPDGQRFLMIVPAEEAIAPVVVILNWPGTGTN